MDKINLLLTSLVAHNEKLSQSMPEVSQMLEEAFPKASLKKKLDFYQKLSYQRKDLFKNVIQIKKNSVKNG